MEEAKKEKKPFVLSTRENDIKYRGPFSYRILRILAFVAIAFAVSATLLLTGSKMMNLFHGKGAGATMASVSNVFSSIGRLSVPLFLIANFTIILQERESYRSILIKYGALCLIVFFGFMLADLRYINGVFYQFEHNYKTGAEAADMLLKLWLGEKLYLNVFIDLFLFALMHFFLNYRPKKPIFAGKKVILFRLLVLLPILYEAAGVVLKGLAANNVINIPILCMPLFPTKPPLMFVAFFVIALIFRHREKHYLNKGCTVEQYEEYLKTNKSSLFFSIQVSTIITIAAIIDIVLLFLFIAFSGGKENSAAIRLSLSWGIGESVSAVFLVPLIMLYSYNRKFKKTGKPIDLFINLGGIGLVVLAVIETMYQITCALI
ncbi:MAG: hypothetical protein K6F07_00825 [Bacilli bacterium]|nr:hypothetical protein [Bacilli bacterium]